MRFRLETLWSGIGEKLFKTPNWGYRSNGKTGKTVANESEIADAQRRAIDRISFDPALLFQWFKAESQIGDLSLEDVMSNELRPSPAALFEAKALFRKADKLQLYSTCCRWIFKQGI